MFTMAELAAKVDISTSALGYDDTDVATWAVPHRSAGGAARRNLAALQQRLFAYKTNGRHPAGHFGVLFFSDAF